MNRGRYFCSMCRQITEKDNAIVKQLTGVNLEGRKDINYNLSGISFNDDGVADSIILIGTRTLTDYYGGSVPDDDYMDDEEGSQEIIGYYAADGTSKDMYKTFSPFVWWKLRNWSQCWYVPKDEEDCLRAIKCLNMTKCKTHNILVKRMA